jgi:hypothetical protein
MPKKPIGCIEGFEILCLRCSKMLCVSDISVYDIAANENLAERLGIRLIFDTDDLGPDGAICEECGGVVSPARSCEKCGGKCCGGECCDD